MPAKDRRPLRLRAIPQGEQVVIVRGDEGNDGARRRSAERFKRRWPELGQFGLSGYYAEDEDEISDIVVSYLYSFPAVLVLKVDAVWAAGLEILPTFKAPHVTVAFEDLDEGLTALASAPRETRKYDGEGRRIDDGR